MRGWMERARTERWFLGPSLMLFAAVLIGTVIWPGGQHGQFLKDDTGRIVWPHEAPVLRRADLFVREFGALLVIPFVMPHCVAWARRSTWPQMEGQQLREDQKRVTKLFFVIAVLRVLLYLPVKISRSNYYLSDHVFLLCSLVAQIQIMHGVLITARDAKVRVPISTIDGVRFFECSYLWWLNIYCWLLLLLFFVEATVTSHTYHTRLASWAGYVTGTVLFSGIAFWATRGAGGAPGNLEALLGARTAERALPAAVPRPRRRCSCARPRRRFQ